MQDIQKVDQFDLSFIIPCYNAEKYIARSIDSIVKHTHNSFKIEIIVINDGSTDDSESIIDKYCNQYNFITKFNKENGGCSSAINLGLQHFKGTYVHILAADDWVILEVILSSLKKAIKLNLDVIKFGLEFFNEKAESTGVKKNQPLAYNKVMSGNQALINGYQPSSICVFLIHKNIFKIKNILFKNGLTHNDVEVSIRIMLSSAKILFTKKTGYCYFRNLGSISKPTSKANLKTLRFDEIVVAKLIKENLNNYNISGDKVVRSIKQNYNNVVWNLLWMFLRHPKELDKKFKQKCLKKLNEDHLYPLKGPLKTTFQKLTRPFFNVWFKIVFNIKSQ